MGKLFEKLNDGQKKAVQILKERYQNNEKLSVVAGIGGAGKSFMVSSLIEELGLDPKQDVLTMTYTGKAARILQERGIPAQTIHKSIYKSFVKKDKITGEEYFTHISKNREEFGSWSLIVLDECSMCPLELEKKIEAYGVPIIALGDDSQLGPVRTGETYLSDLLKEPHARLTQPMRQKEGSAILEVGQMLRNHILPAYGQYGDDVRVIPASEVSMAHALWADQVLTATNAWRNDWNKAIRNAKGFTGEIPQVGDLVINCANFWDDSSTTDNPLVNGIQATIKEINWPKGTPLFEAVIEDVFDGGLFNVVARKNVFDPKAKKPNRKDNPHFLDYGYALSIHKSQGSEWEKVLVIAGAKNYYQTDEDYFKLLYTGLTRASKKVLLAI